jgi:hypothetical protein
MNNELGMNLEGISEGDELSRLSLFMAVMSASRHATLYLLKYATNASFQILSSATFTGRPTMQNSHVSLTALQLAVL